MVKKLENPFGEGASYVRITRGALKQRAQSPHYSLATRIEFACWADANRDNHAEYGAGALAFDMGRMDESGAWVPARADVLSKAIRQAKDEGRIGPESSARCLVAPGHVSQGRDGFGCRVHNLARRARKPCTTLPGEQTD